MKFEYRNAVSVILIVTVAAFILQMVVGRSFTNLFLLVSSDVFARPWILITYMFMHGSPYHLLFNMYVLYAFGPLLEQAIGTKRFLAVYFGTGILAGILSTPFYVSALGASGAIMGMMGVLVMLMPNLQLLMFFFIPMRFWQAAIFIAAIDLFGVFNPSGIGNIAHLVGLAAGVGYGYLIKKQGQKFQKKFSKKKHLNEVDVDEYLRSGRI